MRTDQKIFVAGHRGLVGSAIVRALEARGFADILTRAHAQCDLTNRVQVTELFMDQRPAFVFLAAAKVGGILANDTWPADFIATNLDIQGNIIQAAHAAGVEKLLFLGSSCIYPKLAPQPMREEHLLTGPLEPTNQWYAVAKIAGIKLCQAYRRQFGLRSICLMPTNLYGPGDNFDPTTSHVLPALIRRFHEAKASGAPSVTVWGTGSPRREFLHVDDLADACCFLMERYDEEEIINVGVGEDITIADLAALVAEVVGYPGRIVFDASKPDGTPRKLLDVSRLEALGWKASTDLRQGIASTYQWFKAHAA